MSDTIKMRSNLEKLLIDIRMSPSYSIKIVEAFDVWASCISFSDISGMSVYLREQLNETFKPQNGENTIMLLLLIALEERAHGVWKPYSDEIFIDTMSDFTTFVDFYREATGHEGYGKAKWPLLHVDAKKFKLGALEYELMEEHGRKEVSIHIPTGTDLSPAIIEDSLKKERAFMKEYFPEWAELPYSCESWMLSPALDTMLSDNSKIRWFSSLFDIAAFYPEEKLYLEFVFKLEYFQWINGVAYNTLREDTSLQRAMKEFLLSGGKPGTALGYLKRDNYAML